MKSVDTAARERQRGVMRSAATGATASRFEQGVFVVERDDLTMPFDVPFDLEGASLVFEPLAADRYRVTREPLQYDDDIGPILIRFQGRDEIQSFDLTKFGFPFYGIERRKIYFTSSPSVYFETPNPLADGQHGPLELITERKPLIAPYLFGTHSLFSAASVYLREEADRMVVTWRSLFGSFPYDIQMVLSANGTVRIAYKQAKNGQGSAFAFTSGAEASMRERASLATITDVRADTRTATPALLRDMVDIESVTIDRIGGSELLEVSIKMAQPIDISQLGTRDRLQFFVFFDDEYSSYVGYLRSKDEEQFIVSAWGLVDPSRARIEGSTITLPLLHRYLPAATGRITVATYVNSIADDAETTVTLPPPLASVDSDISAIE
ncbi:MAG TPA: hypothetical protein VIL97_07265, partial [Thermoanaerobaculia bacterium]